MHAGKFVELGFAEQVLYQPAHTYTREQLTAVPALPTGKAQDGSFHVRRRTKGGDAALNSRIVWPGPPTPFFGSVDSKALQTHSFYMFTEVFILKNLNMAFCTKIVQGTKVLQIEDLRERGSQKTKTPARRLALQGRSTYLPTDYSTTEVPCCQEENSGLQPLLSPVLPRLKCPLCAFGKRDEVLDASESLGFGWVARPARWQKRQQSCRTPRGSK